MSAFCPGDDTRPFTDAIASARGDWAARACAASRCAGVANAAIATTAITSALRIELAKVFGAQRLEIALELLSGELGVAPDVA